MHFLNMFFFDIYPYIAGTVFLVGSWLRYDYGQYTWRAASSQMLDRKGMHVGSNLFHIGILGIFAGHFLGMLTPHWMYEAWLPIEVKQKMAMIAGGACGVMTLAGGLLLLVGVIDDRLDLNWKLRIGAQVAATLIGWSGADWKRFDPAAAPPIPNQ